MHGDLPAFDDDRFTAWNDAMARKYDPDGYHHHSNPLIRWVEGRRTRAVLAMLAAKEGEEILEVGVGAGNILAQVPRGRLSGIDLSSFLLERARQRLATREATLVLGDAERLPAPFQHRQFDAVCCSEVLEHVRHPDRVLRGIAAVAKTDARVVVSIPNERLINMVKRMLGTLGLMRVLFPKVANRMDDEWHLHAFSDALLRTHASPNFLVRTRVGIPFGFLPFRYVYLLSVKTVPETTTRGDA